MDLDFPMTTKTILGVIVAAALFGGSVIAADAAGVFSDIIKAKLNENNKALNSLQIKTGAKIPVGEINHGFGVITDAIPPPGAAAVAIVTTTHPDLPFIDSEDQSSPTDPVEHNHIVALHANGVCPAGLAVFDLTFESPGTTNIQSNHVGMNHIPYGDYTGQFGNAPTINSGDDPAGPGTIVSFVLSVHPSGAVCVTPVSSADP